MSLALGTTLPNPKIITPKPSISLFDTLQCKVWLTTVVQYQYRLCFPWPIPIIPPLPPPSRQMLSLLLLRLSGRHAPELVDAGVGRADRSPQKFLGWATPYHWLSFASSHSLWWPTGFWLHPPGWARNHWSAHPVPQKLLISSHLVRLTDPHYRGGRG